MELEQTLLPHLSVNISAKLITSLKILQLSSEELSQTISQEMTDNPALEIEEQALCAICGAPLQDGACPECHPGAQPVADSPADVADYDASSYMETRDRQRNQDGEEDYDPISLVASDMSLSEYLLGAMRNGLPGEDFDIADYLVGSLDEFGYLTVSDDEVAEALNVSVERVR